MENSKILTGDETAEWFVVSGDRWIGPMTVADILEKIAAADLTWAHYAWKEGEPGWRRLCDIDEFKVGDVPEKPTKEIQKEIQSSSAPAAKKSAKVSGKTSGKDAGKPGAKRTGPPPKPKSDEIRDWFLYYNDTQFGPFSGDEINRFLRIGKIHGRVYGWKDGMDTWERLEEIAIFDAGVAESERVRGKDKTSSKAAPFKPAPKDQRGNPRRPLVARLFLANEVNVVVAVCRDVSVGGMQVLTDHVPGKPGTHLKMNVSPSGGDLGGRIPPFVAKGVIVRVLEDGRGFSFRFDKLDDKAKQAIENYIASTD